MDARQRRDVQGRSFRTGQVPSDQPRTAPQAARDVEIAINRESTALRLADQGGFFVGIGRKKMPYGSIPQGQMFVQYMIPAEQRYPYPIVMVHGGGAQGTHMMGLGRRPGWVHYFVQAGYAVYWLDRPSYGRSPYHPDALGASHLPNVPPIRAADPGDQRLQDRAMAGPWRDGRSLHQPVHGLRIGQHIG